MRLFEVEQKFGGLPKKAGVAVLDWKGGEPTRNGKTIKLPAYDEAQFFPLLGGVQFLLQIPTGDSAMAFFGGTDEQPFLVELKPSVITSLRGGEEGFFNSIKPNGVKVLEEAFDTKAVRQGDWFAVPLPLTWKQVFGVVAFCPLPREIMIKENGEIALGLTRHKLHAQRFIELDAINNGLKCVLIGEGILTAPDHSNKLIKGPHAFFQTAHLVNPKAAN